MTTGQAGIWLWLRDASPRLLLTPWAWRHMTALCSVASRVLRDVSQPLKDDFLPRKDVWLLLMDVSRTLPDVWRVRPEVWQ